MTFGVSFLQIYSTEAEEYLPDTLDIGDVPEIITESSKQKNDGSSASSSSGIRNANVSSSWFDQSLKKCEVFFFLSFFCKWMIWSSWYIIRRSLSTFSPLCLWEKRVQCIVFKKDFSLRIWEFSFVVLRKAMNYNLCSWCSILIWISLIYYRINDMLLCFIPYLNANYDRNLR